MKTHPRILIAGSTGYLGSNIVELLLSEYIDFKAIARNKTKLLAMGVEESQVIEAQVTHPDELKCVCEGVDVVISCLGITRQQDGLSYSDVDYQANLNLLLKSTKLTPCVIRPNGFFSDITEVYNMAKSGRVFTFGDGENCLNPIHGKDLAKFCLEAIERSDTELDVGGPDVLSVNDIARLAFKSQNKVEKNTHLPDFLRRAGLSIVRHLPEKWGGPAEFFLTMLGGDNIAPIYGRHRLEDYFGELASTDNE